MIVPDRVHGVFVVSLVNGKMKTSRQGEIRVYSLVDISFVLTGLYLVCSSLIKTG